MNKFEVVLILNPDLSTNTLNDEIDEFKTKLNSHSAKIINEENWGLRDLSYTINKYKKQISDIKNEKIRNSLTALSKVYKKK